MKFKMRKVDWYTAVQIIFQSLSVIGVTVLLALSYDLLPPTFKSTYSLAQSLVSHCKGEDSRAFCYEQEVPRLMDEGLSMEATFAVASKIQELDQTYKYCHVLAHYISAKEAHKDLSKWKNVVARAPSGICGNGAIHGAFQERFRAESLPEASVSDLALELRGVCDPRGSWSPTFLERSSCMHAVGHLSMYATDGNVQKSISLCEVLASPAPGEDFRRTCFDGIFMQIFQPLEPEDLVVVEKVRPTAETRESFCSKFSGLTRTSCVKESWPLVRAGLATPITFGDFCSGFSGSFEEERYCFTGLVYVVFGILDFNPERMLPLCEQLPLRLQSMCFSRTASRFVEVDWRNTAEAVAVCNVAPTSSKTPCFKELSEFAARGMREGSAQRKKLCDALPSDFQEKCVSRIP